MKIYTTIIAACGLLTLAACGDSDIERASTGAVIGGAAAAVTSGNVATGALVGGAAGAVCDSLNACPQN